MQETKTAVQEASERWIREGKAFKDQLNDWLDIIYIDKKQPETECPEETRTDMAGYVLEQIYEFNQEGKYEALRQLFPPDNDPITWKGIAESAYQVVALPDDRLVVTVGNFYTKRVYVINNNEFILQEGLIMFGRSADKKYFARVFDDKITITEGWEGAVVKEVLPPKDYGAAFKEKHPTIKDGLGKLSLSAFEIEQVVVFPSGNRIGLATKKGIFVLDEKGAQFIQTESRDDIEEEDDFTFRYDYPHIDVSPDEKYLAVGSQSSSHLIMEEINGIWTTIATVDPRSSYPNLTKFNYKIPDEGEEYDGPQVLLCSCHFGGSASLSLPVKNIRPGFYASGYNADDTLNYPDDQKWVFSAANYNWGYALGCNDGYIWFKIYAGGQLGYLHVGGTVMDIDFSADRKKMIVASFNGQVITYDCSNTLFGGKTLFRLDANREDKRPDVLAITNTCYVDVKRYLFLKELNPMIW